MKLGEPKMGFQFSADGPVFPLTLIDALLEGEVVFLCGAGVSAPQLPGFGNLVTKIYEAVGERPSAGERSAIAAFRFEEALGALSRRLANPSDVQAAARGLLDTVNPNLGNHRTLMRLSRTLDNEPVIVTTNFDTLFERALTDFAYSLLSTQVLRHR